MATDQVRIGSGLDQTKHPFEGATIVINAVSRVAQSILKRASHDWLMLSAAVVTVVMATTLLAAGPIYADAVTLGSLQRTIANAPPSEPNMVISIGGRPDAFSDFDRIVTSETTSTFEVTGLTVYRHIESESFELTASGVGGLTELAVFSYLEGVEKFATIESGSWPSDTPGGTEVAVHESAADWLGLTVGDELSIPNRTDATDTADVVVVGIYSVDDVNDPFWLSGGLIDDGIEESALFRTLGPFVTTQQALLEDLAPIRARYEWKVFPTFSNLTPSTISELSGDLNGLQDRLDGALGDRGGVTSALAKDFTIESLLGRLLSSAARSLAVTRAGVLMLSAQLGILAAYALVLTAGLLVETRRTETNLLRSRGASSAQLMGTAVGEGILITVPAALVAPWLAVWILGALNRFGPLGQAGLTLDATVTSAAYAVALIAAAGCIAALAIPTYRAARSFSDTSAGHSREKTKSGLQRAGVDLALLALAAFVFWQLRTFGADVTSRAQGRVGIDPLLVAAPALGLLAGGTLAIRTIPLLSRMAERAASRSKATVGVLAAWQIARRPRRYARSALLLIMAVSIGLFAASYTTTWSQSQDDRANFQVGADVRLSPDRRLNFSIGDLQLSTAHEQLDSVDESMPVVRKTAFLARSTNTLGRLVMLDATRAADLINIREDLTTTDFDQLMNRLASQRPKLAVAPLPGEPRRLGLSVEVITNELPESLPEDLVKLNELSPRVKVILQDGDGLLHRLELGKLPVDSGVVTIETSLIDLGADGQASGPVYPLSLVDIEIINLTPPDISREAEIGIHSILVSETATGGQWIPIELSLNRSTWDTSTFPNGRVRAQPSIGLVLGSESDVLYLKLVSGDSGSLFPVSVHYSLRPAGTELPETFPIVVTEGVLEATTTSVGDELHLDLQAASSDTAAVVGTLSEFPTVDPVEAEAVIIDLATFQMMNYRLAAPIFRPNEYWLAINNIEAALSDQLTAAPFESPTVLDRSETAQTLKTDPIALGTIASLSLGFLAATVFAAVGFTVSATVSARERLTEFALLRALGLSNRQLGTWLAIEQGALVAVSLVFGTIVGLVLVALILPLISLTQGGVAAVPMPLVIIPIATIARLEAIVVATLILIVGGLALALRRLGLGSLLRIGDD